MDPLWVAFWGSALGGSLITALSATVMFFMNGARAKQTWARELRLKVFSETIALMDAYGEALYELVLPVIGGTEAERAAAVARMTAPPVAPGQFHLAAAEDIRAAYASWRRDAETYAKLIGSAGVARNLIAHPEHGGSLPEVQARAEELGIPWNPSDDDLTAAQVRMNSSKIAAIRDMQENLGLNAAYMLSEHA